MNIFSANSSRNTVPRSAQLQLSLFFAAIFLTIGCYLPYFPLWLKAEGLNSQQIGFVIGMPLLVRVLFTPLFSLWADYLGDFRKFLILLGILSILSFSTLLLVDGFWAIFIVVLVGAMFWTTLLPLTETMAMIVGSTQKLHYGRARAVGSASFIAASFGFGFLIDLYGAQIVVPLLIITCILIVVAAFDLPNFVRSDEMSSEISPAGIAGSEVSTDKGFKENVLSLMKWPVFWLFLLGSGLGQGCHAFYYGFASVHWETLEFSGALIGALWSVGVIAEIALFVLLGDWLRRFNPVLLLMIGAASSIVRFGFMAFDPPLILLVPLQVLHALSFGIAHLGAIYFIGLAVPKRMGATAQGFYATVSAGVFLGGMVLVSGPLYESIGPLVYLIMSAMALCSALVLIFLFLRWNGEQIT